MISPARFAGCHARVATQLGKTCQAKKCELFSDQRRTTVCCIPKSIPNKRNSYAPLGWIVLGWIWVRLCGGCAPTGPQSRDVVTTESDTDASCSEPQKFYF